jgi:adenylate kinase family enzyme
MILKYKKILIIGTSASGKTTFAKKLKEKLNLPLYYMDEIIWKPNWVYVGDQETSSEIKEIINKDNWILEGWIFTTKEVTQKVFDKSDIIIYINNNSFISCFRYVKRFLKHRKNPRPEIPGCLEKFSLESLLNIWNKTEMKMADEILEKINPEKVIYLKSPKEADLFLKNLGNQK